MRSRVLVAALPPLLAVLAAAPVHAGRMPYLIGGFGATAAIGGDVNEGGLSASVAALWPVARGFDSGVELAVDDFGAAITRLRDPNDGIDLGAVAQLDRQAVGLGWRADGALPALGRFVPYVSGTWGVYRIRDERLGHSEGSHTTAGLSAGAGIRHPLSGSFALGVSGRWHKLFDDATRRWMSVGLEVSWK